MKETEKIATAGNSNKTKDWRKGKRKKKNSEINISHNKNNEQDTSHGVEPINISNSQENIENNDIEREANVTVQNQEIPPENNFIQSSTEKCTSHDRRANNYNRSGNMKSSIVLGDSMTKLLNGLEMAKRVQSNCKIYVKTFSGAMVLRMKDYIKPSLRNPPDHFILNIGTNALSSEKSPLQIVESIMNLASRLKNKIHYVSVSTIILRTDDKKLNEKGIEIYT